MKKIIIALLFISFAVLANTDNQNQTTNNIEALQIADTVIVPVWAKIETPLKVNEVTQVSFTAGQIAEIDPKLLQGVTFNGFARKVSVEGQEIGQVLAVSVVKGDKEVAISATGLTAQFDALKTPELTTDTMLEVEGSRTELLTALQKLAEEEETKEDDKEEKDKQPVEASEGYQSTGSKENDLASSYSTPSNVEWEAEKNPVVLVETTTEGCEPRIDEAQGVVIETAKSYTLTDGAKSGETECSDTLTRYIIKTQSCENQIDEAGMKVYSQYKKSYVNSTGATFEISECEPDLENPMELREEEGFCPPFIDFAGNTAKFRTSLVYTNQTGAKAEARGCEFSPTLTPAPLLEEEASCPPFIDFANNQVKFRTALVYTNNSGIKIEARGCEFTETIASIQLLESIEACPLKHDFANNKSYQMSLKYYEKDGDSIQATSCVNTGVEYQQQKAYGVCPNIVDTQGQTVTLAYRRQITIDGVPQYVSGCTPETQGTPIVGTAEGCSVRHDIETSTSYQQKKYYYMQAGTQIWLPQGCIDSEVSYPHQLEIVGYENYDEQRFSYPKMKITINTPQGVQTVANNVILDGSAQIPYVFDRNTIVGTGELEFSECNRREQREQRDIYKRADNTEYTTAGVPTSPSAWVDACNYQLVGYEHNDNQKISYPKTKATIDTPEGVVTVFDNVVLEGAEQIAYVFDRNSTVNTGEFENSECNRREKREISDIYKRADNTEHTTAGVPTTPTAWVDVCNVEQESRYYHKARLSGLSHTFSGSTAGCPTNNARYTASLRAGYFASKGWCVNNNISIPSSCMTSTASNLYRSQAKTWEAQRITQTRQKKTNPYTTQVFYSSWENSQTTNVCPSFGTCPTTQSQWNNWSAHIESIDYSTSWTNCNDYVP